MKKSLVKIPLSIMLVSAVVFSASAASFADGTDETVPEEDDIVLEEESGDEAPADEDIDELIDSLIAADQAEKLSTMEN